VRGIVGSAARFVVGVTGASGIIYAHRLLEVLGDRADVIVTKDAEDVLRAETDIPRDAFAAHARVVYRGEDLSAPVASGSHPFDALVVVPCSGTTLAKIAAGIADNLVTRAAAVALKERRPVILVPRETPLSPIALEAMRTLANLGVVILPAMPGFYGRPETIADLVDFIVARILDHLQVPHALGPRWAGRPTE
jgi:4-hydroxy-3-polyprenylbenzoate decarboxylase